MILYYFGLWKKAFYSRDRRMLVMGAAKIWMLYWILGMLIILAILALIVQKYTKKNHRKTDYYAFFIIGIFWALVGLIPKNQFFFIIGIVFMAIGLSHKKEWKKNRITWAKLSKDERKARVIAIIVLAIFILVGFVAFLLAAKCKYYS